MKLGGRNETLRGSVGIKETWHVSCFLPPLICETFPFFLYTEFRTGKTQLSHTLCGENMDKFGRGGGGGV